MNESLIPYGTQLSFWEDYPSSTNIVFSITYCQRGCPFNGVYEARDKNTTIYAQMFGGPLKEPTKYLLAVQKDSPRNLNDRAYYYIADNQWEGLDKIHKLTGRHPLWRMSPADEYLPSNYASEGPKC